MLESGLECQVRESGPFPLVTFSGIIASVFLTSPRVELSFRVEKDLGAGSPIGACPVSMEARAEKKPKLQLDS